MEHMPVLVRLCHCMELVLVLVPLRLHHWMEQIPALVLLVRYVQYVRFARQETPTALCGHAACGVA